MPNKKTAPTPTYAQTGVDYSAMDPVKVLAQKSAASTSANLAAFGAQEVDGIRGESAYVWEEADAYRSLVIEGLGTKNLVADEVRSITGKTHYEALAEVGYDVVPEAARLVIDEAREAGISTQELRRDEQQFQEDVASRKQAIETECTPGTLTFFDRGMQDTEAYCKYYGHHMGEHIKTMMKSATYNKIFLLEPLAVYEDDYARTEDKSFRENINGLLVDAYTKYGMVPISIPAVSIADRVKLIQDQIRQEKNR